MITKDMRWEESLIESSKSSSTKEYANLSTETLKDSKERREK